MIEPQYLALIHAGIDDELDEHERAELAGHLLANAESRALRDDLRRVCAALEGMPPVEPPQQLRNSILAALPPLTASRSQARRVAWWSAPAWRYAAVFAGVLLAGGVLYETGVGRGPDVSQVAGTMTRLEARAPVIVDSAQLDLMQVGGRVNLYRAEAGFGLELDLIASAPVDVLVASGDQTLRINGLGGQDSPGGRQTKIPLPGVGSGGQTVNLTFLVAGRQIGTATLSVPAAR
jgi:hypothetical protein